MSKFLSRKFIITMVIVVLSFITVPFYHSQGISETMIGAILAIYVAVGTAYGVLNVKGKATEAADDESKLK